MSAPDSRHLAISLEKLGYLMLIFTILIVPSFVSGKSVNFFASPKQLALSTLTVVGLLLWGARSLAVRQASVYGSRLNRVVLFVLAAAGVSTLFSLSWFDSYAGRTDFFILNFSLLATFAAFVWLLVQHTTSIGRWQQLVHVLMISGGLTVSFFLAKTLLHFNLLGSAFAGIWNTVDVTNTNFGLWAVAIFLLGAGQLLKKDLPAGRLVLYSFIIAASFLALLMLGYAGAWWMLLFGLALLVAMGYAFAPEVRWGWLLALVAFFVTAAALLAFGTPKFLQTTVPVEVSLGNAPTWAIVSKTLSSGVRPLLFGTGAGTFSADFSKFRSTDFNNDPSAATLRFNYPSNTLYGLLVEYGAVTAVPFFVLIVIVLVQLYGNWRHARRVAAGATADESSLQQLLSDSMANHHQNLDALLLSVPWLVLTIGMGLLVYSVSLWWLWWLLLGLVVAGCGLFNPELITVTTFQFFERNKRSRATIMTLCGGGMLLLAYLFTAARWTLADRLFVEGLAAQNAGEAEVLFTKALRLKNDELFHAALAQTYLSEAVSLSEQSNPDFRAISDRTGMAVNEARAATELAPRSVSLWENLATMYENAAAIVPEAGEWAIRSLVTARELEPTNAALAWRLGRDYVASKNFTAAISAYKEAIALKQDYTVAYVSLANAYEQNHELDEALNAYAAVASKASSNPDVLYNYGRLLYNRNATNDREEAEKLWLMVVEAKPNHSNALYSLGLLNELRGNYSAALSYYYKVKELNPANKDIVSKINSLVKGR